MAALMMGISVCRTFLTASLRIHSTPRTDILGFTEQYSVHGVYTLGVLITLSEKLS